MGLLRTMNEVLATARYYQERYDQEMRLRNAEATQKADGAEIVALPERESEQPARAA